MDNPRTFIYSAIEKYVAVGLSFLGMITLSRFLTRKIHGRLAGVAQAPEMT